MLRGKDSSPEENGIETEEHGIEKDSGLDEKSERGVLEIELPQDVEIVHKMQAKLLEYRERLKSETLGIGPQTSPEQAFLMTADTRYKIAVLERLLLDGKVGTQQLARELNGKDGPLFDPQIFENACRVVEDYVETGGKRTTGGTGF